MQLMDGRMGTIGLVIFGADSLLYFLFRHINEVDKSPILHNMATNMSKVSVFRGAERGACASLAYALVGIAAAVGSLTPAVGAPPAPPRCASPAAISPVVRYRVMDLPLNPAAINDSGEVAGTTAAHRAALWSAGRGLRELPLPPGFVNSEAVSINNHGHVLVIAYDGTFSKHESFIFAAGGLTLLSGEQTRAFQISDSGAVVGESLVPGKTGSQPVVWQHHALRPIDSCCGGSATGSNRNGEVIGDTYDHDGRYHAFLWSEVRGMQSIGPPQEYSSAIAINVRGHVLIEAPSGALFHAEASSTRLKLAAKTPSHPRALNDCDVVVGSFGPFSDASRAFVWEKSQGFQDLNSLIPPDSGWKLESAAGINNRGEIVGKGDSKHRDNSGYLLIPD
jgi:probable HAF family extracellular repeat protein